MTNSGHHFAQAYSIELVKSYSYTPYRSICYGSILIRGLMKILTKMSKNAEAKKMDPAKKFSSASMKSADTPAANE